ncbi:hypothetical protein NDU88_000537 [Pleurodeles waltl]|uniref:Uncharacterized protein n=1 Tax=Pleurodeles waltl TaxID=8319 RepID=A0AAV7THJ4_PLEWA|nr:hypothetical protein NDU88_000537 [Pleurodeles waltl]
MASSTASNSNRSSPACSPVLRKRSRSPTPQNTEGDTMVEKGSDHSSDKSPSTPEQGIQRSCSAQSGRSGGKNSKKSQSWYNHERKHIRRVSMNSHVIPFAPMCPSTYPFASLTSDPTLWPCAHSLYVCC